MKPHVRLETLNGVRISSPIIFSHVASKAELHMPGSKEELLVEGNQAHIEQGSTQRTGLNIFKGCCNASDMFYQRV